MAQSSARLMAAAFRSIGIDAHPTPDSDEDTLELGGLHSSGEECLPHKVTLGDFLKLCRAPGADPKKLAFFMPLAPGPCRFGQYAPYLKMVLEEQGFGDVMVVSPSSSDGYNGFTETANELMTTAWLGIVLADLSTRLLLKTRPYEISAGDSGRVLRVRPPGLRRSAGHAQYYDTKAHSPAGRCGHGGTRPFSERARQVRAWPSVGRNRR